ncbi:MAG: Na/Pi symporter [Clostridium sp.]
MLHIAASAMTPANISWDFIIGGLALFLFGIQFMGDGLKSIAGEKLREYIDRYTNKPWKGILVGSIITVFIQSSSATSAIAIGFVRAGLMSLEQSIGIIIGANIGTTVTAFLIGLKVETLALYFVFLGVLITLFAKRKKQTYMGQIVLGFGLLFFGLRLMGDEQAGTDGFLYDTGNDYAESADFRLCLRYPDDRRRAVQLCRCRHYSENL